MDREGNQDWLRSSNDFWLARRKNLRNFPKVWTNNKSSLPRSGPDYPLGFATVKWPIAFTLDVDFMSTFTQFERRKAEVREKVHYQNYFNTK